MREVPFKAKPFRARAQFFSLQLFILDFVDFMLRRFNCVRLDFIEPFLLSRSSLAIYSNCIIFNRKL